METSPTYFLRQELSDRLKSNPQYSLRAFARDLKVDPGFLSHVLKGKRKISYLRATELADHLGFRGQKREVFLQLVQLEATKNEKMREKILSNLTKSYKGASIENLALEHFAILAEWHHYAILELTEDTTQRHNIASFAKRLGISEIEVSLSLERLLKIGLLKKTDSGFKKTRKHFSPAGDLSNLAVKKRHKQILDKAVNALNDVPVENREFLSITMCIDPELLPMAKAEIREFAWKLCESLESKKRKQVYELSTQLFPLEKITPSKKEK